MSTLALCIILAIAGACAGVFLGIKLAQATYTIMEFQEKEKEKENN